MRVLKNEDGSTLLMVVVTVAILTMLGTVLLMMTTLNVKMKKTDQSMKKSLYYSESGIDQVYAYVGAKVKQALKEADDDTKTLLSNKELEIQQEIDKKNNNEVYDEALLNVYLKEDGTLNQEVLQAFAKDEFSKLFWNKLYINTNDIENNTYVPIDSSITSSEYTITIVNDNIENMAAEKRCEIKVQSEFTYNDLKKTVTTDIVINDPNNTYPIGITENLTRIQESPLWQSALVSMQDMELNNAIATVNGDIYVNGSELQLDSISNKGIVVDNGSSLVMNDSQVFTNNYIQTRNSGSKIEINDSEIYCNSLVVQKDSIGTTIAINSTDMNDLSNLYVKDDIELNGTNSSINITGNYYGYSDGSLIASHDSSSCIIVNTNESDPSTLTIQGDDLIVRGTAYINMTPPDGPNDYWPYQTGESLAVKGNYIAYTGNLDTSNFPANTVDFDELNGLNIAVGYNDTYEKGAKLFTIVDKIKYFIDYYTLYGLNLGNRTINLTSNKLYMLGNGVNKSEGTWKVLDNSDYYYDATQAQVICDLINSEYIIRNNYLSESYFSWKDEMGIGQTYTVFDKSPESSEVIYVKNDGMDINLQRSGPNITLNGVPISTGNSVKGLIITDGDVNISGNFTYLGTIITDGNININDGANVTFTNSESNNYFLAKAIKDNNLQAMFPNGYEDKFITVHDLPIISTPSESDDLYNHAILNFQHLITLENWTHK